MFADTYPHLKAKYNVANFETIMEAIDKHFSDIFKLDALDSEAAKPLYLGLGSYASLFDNCMKKLGGLYTTKEVVNKLHELFQQENEIRRAILQNFIFVPPVGRKASTQIGFLEKIATDTLKMAEPISFIDMMRSVNGMKHLKAQSSISRVADFPSISVIHLTDLPLLDAAALIRSNRTLVVNFNRNLKGIPKWGIVDLTEKEYPRVYCETALTEREKSDLEEGLHVKVSSFIGAKANSLPSTGYTALAWLDCNITRSWNFDVNADFAALIQDVTLVYTGGNDRGLIYNIFPSEVDQFCKPAFRRIATAEFTNNACKDIKTNVFEGAYALWYLCSAASLGELDGQSFKPGDLAAVIRIFEEKNWGNSVIDLFNRKGGTNLPPRFATTMSNHKTPELLTETETEHGSSIALKVPEFINLYNLHDTHVRVCRETNANAVWVTSPFYKARESSPEACIAIMMVFTLIRAKAKKRILTIDLPVKFQLNAEEQAFAIATLRENAYITEFNINDNASLQAIRAQLIPTFARNRWLAANNYLPPMVADYWKEAARYWLLHLHNEPNILVPESDKLFKRCVAEMGLKGLEEVLAFLRDESERELLEPIYGKHLPPFYAACPAVEVGRYLRALIDHLKAEAYFPFSELGIAYRPSSDRNNAYIELLGEINKLDRFEKITLTDCLVDKAACRAFLARLTRAALDHNWIGLIVIPELAHKDNVSDDLRDLRVMYAQLNNVILHNRRAKAASALLKTIRENSHFEDIPPPADGADDAPPAGDDDAALPAEGLERAAQLALQRVADDASWPLKKDGAVQLQLQQQQQIQQQRQMQQQQQKVRAQVLEESIATPLVNYQTIDTLLAKYLSDFRDEKNPVYEHSVPLKEEGETELQGFFHTWVNANPRVQARDVIHQMTIAAAKALLRKHRVLPSGLNPDNLPKGFYTQRSKDNDLILCYSPELAYITPPNPLTIDLETTIPKAEAWEGNFLQYDLHRDLAAGYVLQEKDWQHMMLFAKLQPKKDYSDDVVKFRRQNPVIGNKPAFAENIEKITAHWLVFIHAWQCAGMAGVEQFLDQPSEELNLELPTARDLLFNISNISKLSPQLQTWAKSRIGSSMDEDYLRALGQVYYKNGNGALELFLQQLRQIDRRLGREFFDQFNTHVLKNTSNFNCFISEKFFTTMENMIRELSPRAKYGNKLAWQVIMAKQMQAIGWENIEKLWSGFDYFVSELTLLGLQLEGSEFDDVAPENMLVCMDRILESLRHIPLLEKQQEFLSHLARMDRTQGGVHYALQHEGFKYFDDVLELKGFGPGPSFATYAPDLKTLYSWSDEEATLKMKRALASKARFSHETYTVLSERLGNALITSRNQLMWLLHTQYPAIAIEGTIAKLDGIEPGFQDLIAKHLHNAAYVLDYQQLAVNLDAMVALEAFSLMRPDLNIPALIRHYSYGTLVEAVSILWQAKRWESAEDLTKLLAAKLPKARDYPDYFYREGYKLAALFGAYNPARLQEFYAATNGLLPVVQNELRLLIMQLLSVDYNPDTSNLEALASPGNWDKLLQCISEMKAHPEGPGVARIHFIEQLTEQGIVFKYSKRGEFRALGAKEDDAPVEVGFFVDHEDRLWEFMHEHLAVPVEGDAKNALHPIVIFLKVLQLNRTYLNEIEPLLASLEETKPGLYWSASYFYGLLRALQPEGDKASFPISLLKVLLQENLIGAKPLDSVDKQFPPELTASLQLILKNTVFNRNEQAMLCQIALREFNWRGSSQLLNNIMTSLSAEGFAKGRAYALDILSKCKNVLELEKQFANCCWLQVPNSAELVITQNWDKTTAFWLKTLSTRESENDLFASIQSETITPDAEKKSLILHIIAWSSLNPGLKDTESYNYELSKKVPKLVQHLGAMSRTDLIKLAGCYPHQPSPNGDDLLHMIKKKSKEASLNWDGLIDSFMRKPYPEPRADYATLALTRDVDLQRMIGLTQISRGALRTTADAKHVAKLTLIFAYLKRLESGLVKILGADKAISEMNQEELAAAFKRLSAASVEHPDDDLIRAQIWAVLFEVLGRTTRKYPHLAQQYALIANDVCIDAPTRVLQLATGEGKSHFVALRAARHAGMGKVVDVCTAKRTLAERDLEDYECVFSYLGLKSAYIDPKSPREKYMDSQIHYSTTGDLSLFLDEQSFLGKPIDIKPENRVALFDEFDFIRDDEGRKTQYNYARPTGKTPKQMTWFYQVVNDFYTNKFGNVEAPVDGVIEPLVIKRADLADFIAALVKAAGENEEKGIFVVNLLREQLQLVQWLQSAHEAHELERGVGFAVRDEIIMVGEESYPMREIIPLSSDNQKMVGSTFSAGVQQLLAVRLNKEAKKEGKPQNFHIHAESHIISSQVAAQRMQELWGRWEGFSGTISPAQATVLFVTNYTEVLHVPTNQLDLRLWHDASFYQAKDGRSDVDSRLDALVEQIRTCLAKKKSILFSCKNDKLVTELEAQLRTRLTPDELANFIFYTNEDKRTSSDVLADKKKQEGWHDGKKEKGICLVASGFGRGDNVNVEAVFLLNVNDTNDLLQKGGRTARNGAEGEVFQFYLTKELVDEEEYLMGVLEAYDELGDVDMDEVHAELLKIQKDDDNAKRFERVMLLREFVFSLQNGANQGFHVALAQFSAWGMKYLGGVSEQILRQDLMLFFSQQIRRLEKSWVQTSGKADLSVDAKIAAVEEAIIAEAGRFAEKYTTDGAGIVEVAITPFEFEERQPTVIRLVVTEVPKATPRDKAIALICGVMIRLPDLQLDKRAVLIPRYLAALAGDKRAVDAVDEPELLAHDASAADVAYRVARLLDFAAKIAQCNSTSEFVNELEVAVAEVVRPAPSWELVRTAARKELVLNAFFDGVSDDIRIAFNEAMGHLIPELREQIILSLRAANLVSAQKRIERILPIIRHLGCPPAGKFTVAEQGLWGAEYIEQMDQLLQEKPTESLALRLEHSRVMSYSQFDVLWKISKRYSAGQGQLVDALKTVGDALDPASEQRLRMLTKWESLAAGLSPERANGFLTSYCKVMHQFEEGCDWDIFVSLVNKTHEWWNKGDRAYQDALILLWQKSSERLLSLPMEARLARNDFIRWGIGLPGKACFQILGCSLALPHELLAPHQNQIMALWAEIDKRPLKKKEKIRLYVVYNEALQTLYQVTMQHLALQGVLLRLDGERFKRMTDHASRLQAHPEVLRAILGYMGDLSVPLARADVLSEVLTHVAHYQAEHPTCNINRLLAGVEKFSKDDQGLSILLELYAKDANYIEEPLMDGVVSFLKTHAEADARSQAEDVIELFYKASRECAGQSVDIMNVPAVQSLFAFQTETEVIRKQRILFMHLLHKHVFVTGVEPAAVGTDYQWSDANNDQSLQIGFQRYIDRTQHVLTKAVVAKAEEHKGRDLTVNQQHALLHLTDELSLIGNRTCKPDNVAPLTTELAKLIGGYEASWFKSKERVEQSEKLKQRISEIMSTPVGDQMPGRYELVLEAIHYAKIGAMLSDSEQDKHRWFKMNRSGQSRYFDTLSQMHDTVVRHWTKDLDAIQAFQVYQKSFIRDFKDLAVSLQAAVGSLHHDSKYWYFFSKAGAYEEHVVRLDSLKQALHDFVLGQDPLSEAIVTRFMDKLRKDLSTLPGHIVTLANELLARGDALADHLKEHQENIQTGRHLLGGTP